MTRPKPPTKPKPAPKRRSGPTIPEEERRQRGQRGLFLRLSVTDLGTLAALGAPGETAQETILRLIRTHGQARK